MDVERDPGFEHGSEHVVLSHARQEAIRLGHCHIGTEHQLLGLIKAHDPEIGAVLREAGISPEALTAAIESVIPKPGTTCGSRLAYTTRARRVIALAEQEAGSSGSSAPSCMHFLRAILLEGKNIAAHVLAVLGMPGVQLHQAQLEAVSNELRRSGVRWE